MSQPDPIGPMSPDQVQDVMHRLQSDIHYHGLYVLLCNKCGEEVGGSVPIEGKPQPTVDPHSCCPWCAVQGPDNLHYVFIPASDAEGEGKP